MAGIRNTAVRALGALGLACAAVGCQPLAAPQTAPLAGADAGLAFARNACGGCHAVDRRSVSPNPNAPPFAAIVNQEGLTRNTLAAWLRDAHNYPADMRFELDRRRIDDLVAFMLTQRDMNFRPEI